MRNEIKSAYVRILLALGLLLGASCTASNEFPAVELILNGKPYQIEIADTQEQKSRGLMFRQSISRDAGMLFPYEYPVNLNIWMKNTLIPLGVLWLDGQARIIHKQILQPCRTSNCPSFGPDQNSTYALELHPEEIGRFKIGQQLEAIRDWRAAAK